jgi:hypothetical protein
MGLLLLCRTKVNKLRRFLRNLALGQHDQLRFMGLPCYFWTARLAVLVPMCFRCVILLLISSYCFRCNSDDLSRQVAVDRVTLTDSDEVIKTMHGILMELMETVVENMSANHSCLSTSKSPESSTLHHLEQGLGGVSSVTYDQVIHPLVGKPLRGVDSSQSIIEIRKNGEACTSEDTCPTPEQVGFEGVELGFCEQFTYEEAWCPPRAGDQLSQGCRLPLSHTSASSTCAKILQDQWSRYLFG